MRFSKEARHLNIGSCNTLQNDGKLRKACMAQAVQRDMHTNASPICATGWYVG